MSSANLVDDAMVGPDVGSGSGSGSCAPPPCAVNDYACWDALENAEVSNALVAADPCEQDCAKKRNDTYAACMDVIGEVCWFSFGAGLALYISCKKKAKKVYNDCMANCP